MPLGDSGKPGYLVEAGWRGIILASFPKQEADGIRKTAGKIREIGLLQHWPGQIRRSCDGSAVG